MLTYSKREQTEAYSEPCQASKDEAFCEDSSSLSIVNYFRKSSILEVWQGSEYTSVQ